MSAHPITRLYGEHGAEHLYASLYDAAEMAREARHPDQSGSVTIEEWNVHPPRHHMPTAQQLLDWIVQWPDEFGEVVEGFYLPIDDGDVRAAAEALLDTIAARVSWRMAYRKVAQHAVEWSDGQRPTVNGSPIDEGAA